MTVEFTFVELGPRGTKRNKMYTVNVRSESDRKMYKVQVHNSGAGALIKLVLGPETLLAFDFEGREASAAYQEKLAAFAPKKKKANDSWFVDLSGSEDEDSSDNHNSRESQILNAHAVNAAAALVVGPNGENEVEEPDVAAAENEVEEPDVAAAENEAKEPDVAAAAAVLQKNSSESEDEVKEVECFSDEDEDDVSELDDDGIWEATQNFMSKLKLYGYISTMDYFGYTNIYEIKNFCKQELDEFFDDIVMWKPGHRDRFVETLRGLPPAPSFTVYARVAPW